LDKKDGAVTYDGGAMTQGLRLAVGRRRGLEAVLLLAAAVVFGEVCTLPLEVAARTGVAGVPPGWLLPLDDAYIFVRYAQQAARGRPWQWNTGEPSTGASSALWPWLLVPAHWLFGDLADWSRWSRWMGVASLWALGLAAVRALRAARLPEPWPLAGGLCLVWSGPVGFGAVAGMESAANAALLVLACALWMESLDGEPGAAPAGGGGDGPRSRGGERFAAWRSARSWTPIVTSLLPLGRPENGALVAVAALAVLVAGGGRGARGPGAMRRSLPWPRWTAFAMLVPGALLALCNYVATGSFAPAGAVIKSWVYVPFLPLGARAAFYLAVLRRGLLPVYLGAKPAALWPPVGLLAAATAAASLLVVTVRWRRRRAVPVAGSGANGGAGAAGCDAVTGTEAECSVRSGSSADAGSGAGAGSTTGPGAGPMKRAGSRAGAGLEGRLLVVLAPLARLAPLAVAWLVLMALAPLSILLLWQEMRHHHAGLALAWLLALAGAALGLEALADRRRPGRRAVRGAAPADVPPGDAADERTEPRAEVAAASDEQASIGGEWWPDPASAARRFRSAPLLLPLLLVLAFPHWARESGRGVIELYRGHARAAAWLATHDRHQVLLLTDAGLLAIAHDGPAIDALGLGSPDLTEAAMHGPGALVESLARRRPLPEIAAVDPGLIRVPQLLGEPLLPRQGAGTALGPGTALEPGAAPGAVLVPGAATDPASAPQLGPSLAPALAPAAAPPGEFTVLARVRRELLVGTASVGSVRGLLLDPGLDFAYLPDERRHRLLWRPPPLPPHSSAALLLPDPLPDGTGALALQGCRPLFGGLGIELPAGVGAVRLRAAVLAPVPVGEVLVAAGDAHGPAGGAPLAVLRLAPERWSNAAVTLPAAGASFLWLTRHGPGLPCLESLRFGYPAHEGPLREP
jgi:hypothetical protein